MSVIERIVSDDRVWSKLSQVLAHRGRRTASGYINFNCPMCTLRNETADRRERCGVRHDSRGTHIYCFNCGFHAGFRVGERLSRTMRQFMTQVGLAPEEIAQLNHWASTTASITSKSPDLQRIAGQNPQMHVAAKPLPDKAVSIRLLAEAGCDDPDFIDAMDYLLSRGEEFIGTTTFYWTPERTDDLNRRIILPCIADGHIIGWTARAIDKDVKPKYLSRLPHGVLFNTDVAHIPERPSLLLVEGVFDALAVSGISTFGARISEPQIAWLNGINKTKIVVPQADRPGGRIIEIAVANGWHVSAPFIGAAPNDGGWWEPDVKDCAAAVTRYGRLYTLRSVIACATSSPIKINLLKKHFAPFGRS